MSGISAPIKDLLSKLSTLQVTNSDGNTVNLYARIWNNQIKEEENGKLYDFPKPSAFLEIINEAKYDEIGCGFQSCDLGIRVHFVHEFYNAEGTFEQDLLIFDLRDSLVSLLSFYTPTGCGPMIRTGESQDYNHSNLYHYIIDFITNFTDSKGSAYDPATGKYIYSTPPTNLSITNL
ncbi:MAG: hypothetical protein M3Z26_00510 [Bacteroidota bacterium]|nr:hypothetical protein [Bacteroidota bacterium]